MTGLSGVHLLSKSEATYSEHPEPTAPHFHPIAEIHRGPDAYVTFHRKRGDEMENLGSVPTAELETMFPVFAAELETDSYFSVNSFYRPGYYGSCLPQLKPTHRRSKDARYLNACFVDIDFHDRSGALDFGHQFGQIITLQEKSVIPPASLVMRSGRGIWLFWVLADSRDAALPPRAFPAQVLGYNAIELELIRRTNADKAACDVARITRIPGSINSKAGDAMRVMYWAQRAANGQPYRYTLESLACFLGIELPQLRPSRHATSPSSEASARGIRGWRALWQHRLNNFNKLREMRGMFSEGCRNRTTYIYALILRGVGMTDSFVQQEVTRLGKECCPALTMNQIDDAVDQSKQHSGKIRDSTIASYLKVTPEEAQYIPCWANPSSLSGLVSSDMNLKYSQRASHRQQVIREIVDALGSVPSCRKMAQLLRQHGIEISHVQVSRDYKKLQPIPSLSVNPLLLPGVSDVTLVGREGEWGGL